MNNNWQINKSTDGINWTLVPNFPIGSRASLDKNNNTTVVVGNSPLIKCIYSTNNESSWFNANGFNLNEPFQVRNFNNVWISVGNGITGSRSTDGINWSNFILPFNRRFRSIGYGNNRFIVLGQAENINGYAFSTNNGLNWSSGTFPFTRQWSKILWANNKWTVIAHNSEIGLTSNDGINWSSFSMPYTGIWRDIAYTPSNGFVAVATLKEDGSIPDTMAVSSDGISWSGANLPMPINFSLIESDNISKYVMIKDNSNLGYVYNLT